MQCGVVTVGKLENTAGSSVCGCGSTFNVICDALVMHGTARTPLGHCTGEDGATSSAAPACTTTTFAGLGRFRRRKCDRHACGVSAAGVG